jgi:hypothetical protein
MEATMAQPAAAHTDAKLSDAIHKELTNKLRFSGIGKDQIAELVGIVAQIYQQGLNKTTVFPKGRPAVDSILVSGVVDSANLSAVLTGILTNVPRLTGVVVFPYGIVAPETFQVNVQLGGAAGE